MTPQSLTHQRALEPTELKSQLRAIIRKGRADRSERRLQEHAEALRDHVLALPSIERATCVSVYASRRFEPGTLPLIEALHQRGVRVLIPMLGEGLKRGWGVYQGVEDLIERAPGRPPEPSGEFLSKAALRDADVVIVPALAVDTSGTRLGQGGGWYDRALADANPDAPIVALTFAGELRDETHSLPREAHDVTVHAVITPQGVTRLPE